MLGKQVERAINLFPEHIYSIFSERDERRLQAYFLELHEYVTKCFDKHGVRIVLQAEQSYMKEVISSVLPNVEVLTAAVIEAATRDSAPLIANIEQALSQVIANDLIHSFRLPASLYDKIYRIIRIKANLYLKDLLWQGRFVLQLKVVDYQAVVHTIHKEITVETASIYHVLELYKRSLGSEEMELQALYHLYDDNANVTFISPFSYGKSTLINGLFGQKMLSMDIGAETTIITKIVSADENRLLVKYDNNRIIMHKFEDYIVLREKLKELTGVHNAESPVEVQIHHTLDTLPGITVIDTPGLNSRHSSHNEIAYAALRMSDLVMFLIHPLQIGDVNFSRQMMQYLKTIKKRGKKYGFVLSKLDLFDIERELIMNELAIMLQNLDPEALKQHMSFVSGQFALYGKQLRDDQIDISEVRRSSSIFVKENNELIRGRGIESHHAESLIQFSQIEELEQFIRERGEQHNSNECNLDHKEQEAASVT